MKSLKQSFCFRLEILLNRKQSALIELSRFAFSPSGLFFADIKLKVLNDSWANKKRGCPKMPDPVLQKTCSKELKLDGSD